MKVALVRARYTPYGGAERFVQRALEALAAGGLEVTVLAREWAGAAESPEAPADGAGRIEWLRVDPFHIGRIWRDLSFRAGVRRALAARRFDLVQSHERIPGLPIYRAGDGVHRVFMRQRARVLGPLQRLRLAFDPHHRLTLATEARMFAHPALRAVICNSEQVRREIAELFGVDPARLHLLRNGVDTARFAPPDDAARQAARQAIGLPEAAPTFVFVGSGFERKGLAPAIDALARCRAGVLPQARLLVVGHDKHAARYRRRAARLGLDGAIEWAGAQRDVRPWLHAADAFLLPSLYDPFPNAALEALACGLPVVASATTGVSELIREGDNGCVVDALDVDAIAAAMVRLAGPGQAMRRATARATAEGLSLDALAAGLRQLYDRLLAEPGVGSPLP